MDNHVNTKRGSLVQFRYALGDNGRVVDAFELTDDSKGENIFKCAGCGGQCHVALRRLRNKNHFRHLSDKKGVCNKEVYLHRTAKYLFYEEYNKCLSEQTPFNIEIAKQLLCGKPTKAGLFVCDKVHRYLKHDLTKYYDVVNEPEKKTIDQYTPDVVLERSLSNDTLGIEIYYSHKVTEEKRGSGLKLIEIRIRSERDLDIIKNHQLRQDDVNIFMYNFKTISEEYSGDLDDGKNACLSCNKRHGLYRQKNAGHGTACPAYDLCDDKRCLSCRESMSISSMHGRPYVPKALRSYNLGRRNQTKRTK